MLKSKISLAFEALPESKFMETCKGIDAGMTGNVHFTELSDLTTTFQTGFKAYEDSVPKKNVRNQLNVGEMNEQRDLLTPIMRKLAYAVMSVADDNRTMLETSGFPLNTPSVKPDEPELLKMDVNVML